MKAERARILDMLHQGAIDVDQAERLLDALEQSYKAEAPPATLPAEPTAGPGGLAGGVVQRVMQGLSGALGGLKGIGGAGRTNFSTARLTNESLSRMPDGTAYTNFGAVTVAADVQPALLRQKIREFTNFGSVTGPANVIGVLESLCEANFGSFGGEDENEDERWEGPKLSNLGRTTLTREQLENMGDGGLYSNLGRLRIAGDIPADLLRQKIARYENLGRTYGPAALIAILQARCPENLGRFEVDGEEED